jgi:outer membrane protein assembly factor BamB
VAGGNSDLYALRVSDGTVLWSTGFAGGHGAASSPVAGNGVVYIAGYDDNVYAFAA